MLRQHSKNSKKNRPRLRFAGICKLAKELQVGREHIYRVLTGERKSPRIEAAAKTKWPRYFTHRSELEKTNEPKPASEN